MITVRADFGGGPEHVYLLIEGLKDYYDIYIACPDDFPYYDKYKNLLNEKNIIKIPHRKFTLKDTCRIKRFIRINQIDLIHSHGKGAGIYSRFLVIFTRLKCIHTFHGLHSGSYGFVKKKIYFFIEKFLSLFTKKIIAVSAGELNDLVKHKICKPSKLVQINNGIKIQKFSANFPNQNQKFRVVTITRFDYQKYSEMLIDIINELNKNLNYDKFEFVIIGTGDKENFIRQKIENLNSKVNVIFTGGITNPNEILKECHCYISTSRWEGLPLAVLEAMANALPVIATNVVGNSDIIIHNHNGFLFNIEKPTEAVNYILKLADERITWQIMSGESKKTVEECFSLDQMLEKTRNLYESLFEGNES